MISAATIAGLEERRLEYILGARERSDAIAKAVVLKNKDPFVPLLIERKRGETQLFAKEVTVEGRRYVVCRNEAEAEKDRRDRQAIVAALQDALRRGEKTLIGNTAYRRYLRKSSAARGERVFEIDVGRLAEEARFDGIFVLRTNADVTPLQAVLRYRELLQVEQLFRQSKAVFDTRPIFHSSDAAIRGHAFCPSAAETPHRPRKRRCPQGRMEDAATRTRSTEPSAHALIRQRLAHPWRYHALTWQPSGNPSRS